MTSALWKISVVTSPEAEDAVTAGLDEAFGRSASSYTDVESGTTTVAAYFTRKPIWDRATRIALVDHLQKIKDCGLDIGSGRVSLARVRRQDWAESWKRHFRPIEIGRRLLIRPSWSRRRAKPGQALVILDPGLSFGNGQHPTTSFCLRELVARRRDALSQSFLDIGTGSGILAISAARLGYTPIVAMDFDPDAVRIARANAQRNRVAKKIGFNRQDARKLPAKPAKMFSVVCANLIANLLLEERERIVAQVEPGGILVLAGILELEFVKVRRAFEAAGLRMISSRAENEWQSGSFRRG
jgi:ribosomal protein L11 methyltransferase